MVPVIHTVASQWSAVSTEIMQPETTVGLWACSRKNESRLQKNVQTKQRCFFLNFKIIQLYSWTVSQAVFK